MANPRNITPDKKSSNFELYKSIKKNPIYTTQRVNRMQLAEDAIVENVSISKKSNIRPGHMIYFKYFTPKHKEELEYYDARPLTIFFGVFNSSQGKRVLGFNLHYYPPSKRYRILNKIFNIYKPLYLKYFDGLGSHELDAFDYQYLLSQFRSHKKLQFGLREYIPSLMGDVRDVPPEWWSTAVFTEGWFKKKTRAAIMKFWQK